MKKYFKYDDEYISGGRYFLRSFLQYLLCYPTGGLAFYLISVTTYKRAKSMSSKHPILWAIWGGGVYFACTLMLFVSLGQLGGRIYIPDWIRIILSISSCLFFIIPYLYLIFKKANDSELPWGEVHAKYMDDEIEKAKREWQ